MDTSMGRLFTLSLCSQFFVDTFFPSLQVIAPYAVYSTFVFPSYSFSSYGFPVLAPPLNDFFGGLQSRFEFLPLSIFPVFIRFIDGLCQRTCFLPRGLPIIPRADPM